MKYRIKTLSPVHIGSGNNLEPFEYVTENSKFYRIDQNKLFRSAVKKYPGFAEKFSVWIEEKTAKINLISSRDYKPPKGTDKNKMLQDERRSFNLKSFIIYHYKDKDLASEINKSAHLYKCDISFGLSGRKQISELIKDHACKPFIPGSSIRGAIRSAIAAVAFEKIPNALKKELFKQIRNSKSFENRKSGSHKVDEPIERELFLCGYKRKDEERFDDIKFDLMKFIKISDALPTGNADFEILVPNLYSKSKEPQSQLNALEVISQDSEFEFEITVDVKSLKACLIAAKVEGTDKWIGFNTKFERLFGINPDNIIEDNLETEIINNLENILTIYYKKAENSYIDWLKAAEANHNLNKTKYDQAMKSMEKVSGFNGIKMNFAWGSGFEVKTLYYAALKDNLTKEFMQEILNRFEIGVTRDKKVVEKTPLKLENFPKSKRLIFDQYPKVPQYPMGWIGLTRVQ